MRRLIVTKDVTEEDKLSSTTYGCNAPSCTIARSLTQARTCGMEAGKLTERLTFAVLVVRLCERHRYCHLL